MNKLFYFNNMETKVRMIVWNDWTRLYEVLEKNWNLYFDNMEKEKIKMMAKKTEAEPRKKYSIKSKINGVKKISATKRNKMSFNIRSSIWKTLELLCYLLKVLNLKK